MEIKRIDKARMPTTGEWTIDDSWEPLAKENELRQDREGEYSKYAEYAFVVRRKLYQSAGEHFPNVTTKILIFSDVLLTAAREVLKDVQRLPWNVQPFKVWFSLF